MDIHLRSLVPCPSFSTDFLDGAKGKQQVLKELGGRVKSSAHCTLISTLSVSQASTDKLFNCKLHLTAYIFQNSLPSFWSHAKNKGILCSVCITYDYYLLQKHCAIIWSPSMATLRGTDIFKRATLVGNNKFMRKTTSKGLSHVSYRVRTQRAKQLSQSKSTSKMLWSIPKYVPTMRCCLSGPEASEGPTR